MPGRYKIQVKCQTYVDTSIDFLEKKKKKQRVYDVNL